MSSVISAGGTRAAFEAAHGGASGVASIDKLTERDAFQAAVAGTFFKLMMKSMHKMHGQPAYFHGGQAEEFFQTHLDEQIAEDLARTHGAPLTDALYSASVRNRISTATEIPPSASLSS